MQRLSFRRVLARPCRTSSPHAPVRRYRHAPRLVVERAPGWRDLPHARRRVVPLLLASMVAPGLLALSLGRFGAEPDRNGGGGGPFTAETIRQRSAPVCAALVPEGEQLHFAVERIAGAGANGRSRDCWYVFFSPTGRPEEAVGSLVWNADTGELSLVNNGLPRPILPGGVRTSAQAVRAARYWLGALPVGKRGAAWRQVGSVRWSSAARLWQLTWRQAAGGRVHINLCPASGGVRTLQAKP